MHECSTLKQINQAQVHVQPRHHLVTQGTHKYQGRVTRDCPKWFDVATRTQSSESESARERGSERELLLTENIYTELYLFFFIKSDKFVTSELQSSTTLGHFAICFGAGLWQSFFIFLILYHV